MGIYYSIPGGSCFSEDPLRRKYATKLPDAIIAATCIVYDLPLVTADIGFTKISELDVILIEI